MLTLWSLTNAIFEEIQKKYLSWDLEKKNFESLPHYWHLHNIKWKFKMDSICLVDLDKVPVWVRWSGWGSWLGRPDSGGLQSVCPPQCDLSSVGHAVKGDGFICCQRKYLRFFTDKVSSDFFAALRKVMSNIWSDGNEWQQTSWQWTMLSFV